MRIWLDTDIGSDVDDALALAYILRHPDLELVGISTVFGDIPLRGQIAEALLAQADAAPVPLLPGMGVPLSERRQGIMFGHEGLGVIENPEPALRVREETGAERRIDELATMLAETEPDVLVAIGPMTNVGALAAKGVDLPPLAVMGGRIESGSIPGMTDEISEWNWHCDPLAVKRVLATEPKVPPLIVPAEVTFQTRLTEADLDRLAEGDALNRTLAVLSRQWLTTQREQFGTEEPSVALHDPLTVALLVEPDLCTYRTRRIELDDRAFATDAEPGSAAPELRVAATVDAEAVRQNIMDVLTGGQP
ncbi:MAG: nucleoside hydrolase [Acidimicrobiales bacterium]